MILVRHKENFLSTCTQSIFAAEAARRLGVSIKALRLYEQRGLLQPMRTQAGYRHYSPDDLRAAQDIVALRSLGLTMAQTAQAAKGNLAARDQAFALREAELVSNYEQMAAMRGQHAAIEERQRIMSDLHDGLGSHLFTSLSRIERGAIDASGVAQILRDCISEMRLALEVQTADGQDFRAALPPKWQSTAAPTRARARW